MNFSDTFRPLQENDEIFDWIPLYEEHLRNEPHPSRFATRPTSCLKIRQYAKVRLLLTLSLTCTA